MGRQEPAKTGRARREEKFLLEKSERTVKMGGCSMKKRISAIFLALCMMVGFLPVNAQADGETSHNIGDDSVTFNSSCGDHCPGHVITGTSDSQIVCCFGSSIILPLTAAPILLF